VRQRIVLLAALAVGCGRPADPTHPTAKPVVSTKIAAPTGPLPSGTRSGPAAPAVVPVVGCPTPTCAFHAGAGAYFVCLAGGAGACFHFGPACAPTDSCMYDPGDRTYKQCARSSEGTCQQWASACAPTSQCMFDAADGLHHACDEIAAGTCKRYGALCAP
jgi:hypothetical protein